VFTEVVKFGEGVKNYPVYLLCAIVLFTYFGETTSRGVTSLVDRDNLLRKIRFPRLVIPLAVALHSLFNLGLNMIAVFVFVVAAGIEPNIDWLQLPLLVGMIVVLATGVTMMLSALYVRFRDVEPIWEVALQLLFYASPVIYVVTTIPNHDLQRLAVMNPIGAILTQMRHALVDPSAPTAITVLGGWQWLVVPTGIVVALFALGWWVFMREAPRIAENL
jgi:ABC-2 type transport system permease protein